MSTMLSNGAEPTTKPKATEAKPMQRVVVIGHGMVGHQLVESLTALDADRNWSVVILGEEPRPAYDRVALSSFFSGVTPEELSLVTEGFFEDDRLTLHTDARVVGVDPDAKVVTTAAGQSFPYDVCVFATGSTPFVPPVPGYELPGCFVYRTIEDLEAMRDWAGNVRTGAVVGGGLLGLEAATALLALGLETHVVEFAPRLMPAQIDEGAGSILRNRIEDLGVIVHTATETKAIHANPSGSVGNMEFADGTDLTVDMVVFSAGIRPRDDLARATGLTVGERGGIVIDETCRTSDPHIYAIGECALYEGRIYGLVAPGYAMARVVADRIVGGESTFTGADMSTKLKVLGVDVASFGDAFARTPDATPITWSDPVEQVYKRLVVGAEGQVMGGILVGDITSYDALSMMARGDLPTPAQPASFLFPARDGQDTGVSIAAMPDSAKICSCNNVTKGAICEGIAECSLTDIAGVKATTRAGTTCGGCVPMVTELLRDELTKAGIEVRNDLCEHFSYSRTQLFDIVRSTGIRTFSELVTSHGNGGGCEICKPAVASILASLSTGYILDGEQAALQDTNDHFLANLQRDGTYSIVPRVPGGEITPLQLITLGEIARDFNLYTKITGGQRIDLFGARVDDLPAIWQRMIDVGMESGHAYGKALRTVKSCVGLTWCRYGVQDSTALAIELELRYRGLRAPHKIKSGVSGCTRECAEAQSKDFGVIATERGWNLYVGGNGGTRPQHAMLFAEDLDTETLIRYIDRFLMFYIRTADRLERTATWINRLEGGLEYLKSVVIDDALKIADQLEADMARHVDTYACEWKATLDDPARVSRFRSFINDDGPDSSIVHFLERGQPRPAPVAVSISTKNTPTPVTA